MSVEEPIMAKKSVDTVRFLTFNVNGLRTFFHYQPFTEMNQSLSKVFDYFKADIITFQELKTDRNSILRWGKVAGFNSFISIPQKKKGYSGVGCWIRIYPADHPMHAAMRVLKAEEGITGLLTVKVGNKNVRFRDDPSVGIGGYEALGLGDGEEKEGLKIDSEGRCVIIELACNLVVINVYCPANSTLSEEGHSFRLKFLSVLFKRIRNIEKIGKKVVLMGDLNVCRDLIDHAESLERERISINGSTDGIELEDTNRALCTKFILSPDSPHRRLLNQMLSDSIIADVAQKGILLDTTRLIQTRRRLKMYTVWNTLKNARASNYGSRIDFILVTTNMKTEVENADIMQKVMGSDHCPVFADVKVPPLKIKIGEEINKLPRFEARYKYGLMHGNILDMFGRNKQPTSTLSLINATNKEKACDKEPKKRRKLNDNDSDSIFIREGRSENNEDVEKRSTARASMKNILGKPPLCKHELPAELRTSKTAANPGKRFWICKLPKGSSQDDNSSCGFFQWA